MFKTKIIFCLTIISLIFLTSCSNTRIFVEGTKKVLSKAEEGIKKKEVLSKVTKGHYKIGKPYKVNGIKYYPKLVSFYEKNGIASWYGPKFDKKLTANGEIFNQKLISAAHKTLPLPSIVKVTNLANKKYLYIRVNDRGPFVNDRIIDLSKEAAIKLNIYQKGTEKVSVKLIDSGPHLLEHKYLNQELLNRYSKNKEQEIQQYKVNLLGKYFLQIGAFSSLDNADYFIRKVKESLTFEEDIKIMEKTKQNPLYKIVIGPFSRDDKLKILADKLSELGYNFIIINQKENIWLLKKLSA